MDTKALEITEKNNTDKELTCDAKYHINECRVFKDQIMKDKNLLVIAKVNDLEIGICDNGKFIELLNNEIEQAALCLEKKPNKFMEFMSYT